MNADLKQKHSSAFICGILSFFRNLLGEDSLNYFSAYFGEAFFAALVQEGLYQSLLGMSFLQRLKGFELQGGALTINR